MKLILPSTLLLALLPACYRSHERPLEVDAGARDAATDSARPLINERVIQVAAGAGNACALLESGGVACWGGTSADVCPTPSGVPEDFILTRGRVVPGISGAVEIVTNGYRHCVRTNDGEVRCWGADASSCSNIPVSMPALRGAIDLDTSLYQAELCALMVDGTVRCIAYGATTAESIRGVSEATSIDVGSFGSCARVRGGVLRCWDARYEEARAPERTGDIAFEAVAAEGIEDSCGVVEGRVACWGSSSQLHQGTGSLEPSFVPGLEDIIAIDMVFLSYACALSRSGQVYCWGDNGQGQLGDGTTISRYAARPVLGVSDAIQISTGPTYACATLRSGRAVCWGNGWLGNGENRYHPRPLDVAVADARELDVRTNQTCAIRRDRTLVCWGELHVSGYPDAPMSAGSATPVEVATDVVAACGDECWVTSAGRVGCRRPWDSERTRDIHDARAIACGVAHACVLHASGGVSCWGSNERGQLGNGSFEDEPGLVSVPVGDAVDIAAGDDHTCVRDRADRVWCWGRNEQGELGDGTELNRAVPAQAFVGASELVCGGGTSCVRRRDGSIWCWGTTYGGAICDGACRSTRHVSVPTRVDLGEVVDLRLGPHNACVVRPDRTVECIGARPWVAGFFVALAGSHTWRAVEGLGDVARLGAPQGANDCAIVGSGAVRCWGFNEYGQLGVEDVGFHTRPVEVLFEP